MISDCHVALLPSDPERSLAMLAAWLRTTTGDVWRVIAGDPRSTAGRDRATPAASSKPTRQIEECSNILGASSGWIHRSVAPLPCVFFDPDTLPTGPRGVLDQVIRCVQGLQFEACVPPVLLVSEMTLPMEASILNLTYSLGGCNAVWDALTVFRI
jgi:hypothetical protein